MPYRRRMGPLTFRARTERGGPPVTKPEGAGGFGSKLVTRSMSAQLGGSLDRQFVPEGVIVTIRINKDRLAR